MPSPNYKKPKSYPAAQKQAALVKEEFFQVENYQDQVAFLQNHYTEVTLLIAFELVETMKAKSTKLRNKASLAAISIFLDELNNDQYLSPTGVAAKYVKMAPSIIFLPKEKLGPKIITLYHDKLQPFQELLLEECFEEEFLRLKAIFDAIPRRVRAHYEKHFETKCQVADVEKAFHSLQNDFTKIQTNLLFDVEDEKLHSYTGLNKWVFSGFYRKIVSLFEKKQGRGITRDFRSLLNAETLTEFCELFLDNFKTLSIPMSVSTHLEEIDTEIEKLFKDYRNNQYFFAKHLRNRKFHEVSKEKTQTLKRICKRQETDPRWAEKCLKVLIEFRQFLKEESSQELKPKLDDYLQSKLLKMRRTLRLREIKTKMPDEAETSPLNP